MGIGLCVGNTTCNGSMGIFSVVVGEITGAGETSGMEVMSRVSGEGLEAVSEGSGLSEEVGEMAGAVTLTCVGWQPASVKIRVAPRNSRNPHASQPVFFSMRFTGDCTTFREGSSCLSRSTSGGRCSRR